MATRPLAELDAVTAWLAAHRVQHNTNRWHWNRQRERAGGAGARRLRLGNTVFAGNGSAPRLAAVLDWELATLGDPLADLGYLCATWSDPGDPDNPMRRLSDVTRNEGFLGREQLGERYAERTSARLDAIAWYEVLALWKCAIFLEASYRRYLEGMTDDPFFAGLRDGVPALARAAAARVEATG